MTDEAMTQKMQDIEIRLANLERFLTKWLHDMHTLTQETLVMAQAGQVDLQRISDAVDLLLGHYKKPTTRPAPPAVN